MDIMWIAIAVDMAIYALLGVAVVLLGKRFLPAPWNRVTFTVPVALVVGALITLSTFPHWLVFPR
jgi:hypothetical protein